MNKILFSLNLVFFGMQDIYGANINFSFDGSVNSASSFITIDSQALILEEGKQGVDTTANTIRFIDTIANSWSEGLGSFNQF